MHFPGSFEPRRGRIDSAEGVIEYTAPQVRGLSGWTSEVRAAPAGKSEELTQLAVEMYAPGLSALAHEVPEGESQRLAPWRCERAVHVSTDEWQSTRAKDREPAAAAES